MEPVLRLDENDHSGAALAERVYDELRAAICDYRLAPNQRLVQKALAAQLGISRTPVRDALLRLSQEGLVRTTPWRGGYLVTEFTEHEVIQIYEVRLALEPIAAELAAGTHSAVQIARLRETNGSIAGAPADAVAEHYELNRAFHAAVVEPADNAILRRMLDQLWSMPSSLRMYYHQVATGDSVQAMAAEHAAIIEALELGDGTLARQRVHAHISGARQDALEHFRADAA